MTITGEMLIGATALRGSRAEIRAIEAATGQPMDPAWAGGSAADVDRACALAEAAFDTFRELTPDARATFLETAAQAILDLGDELIVRAMAESGLPRPRLEGERGRTVGQLRLFASTLRAGHWLDARIDPAQPQRQPLPRADLRLRQIPVGPVAVFGASNFPLAFSVAGGDTASAFAAGCPVVVKAHSAHPGTSELVGRAIQKAVAQCGLPEGVFSVLFGSGADVGSALVADPRIKAVGFTGSRAGGLALVKIAQSRPEPIPVYAEMSSINPVYLLPAALEARAEALGTAFVGSLTMGAGQFCTNPGLVLAVKGAAADRFLASAVAALGKAAAATMLTPGICAAYAKGVAKLAGNAHVTAAGQGLPAAGPTQGQAALFTVAAADFLVDEELQEEVFGSSSLVILCDDLAQLHTVTAKLEGQLTATLQLDEGDHDAARALLPLLERKAGRILANGWPTGVEVCHAMVHGGPFPATSDARTTSVGTLAMRRFLRPVCYQDLPDALLPAALQAGNPLNLWRLTDGELAKA